MNSPGIRNHLTRDSGLPEDCAVQIRLPSEAEWELAARWNKDKGAPDDRLYPWPDEKADIDLNERCNWDGTKIGNTSAVGLFPKGNADCGAADLAGNVWEWCQTKWVDRDDKDAPKRFNSGVYDADDGEETRVLRGGSWVQWSGDLARRIATTLFPAIATTMVDSVWWWCVGEFRWCWAAFFPLLFDSFTLFFVPRSARKFFETEAVSKL